MKTLALLAALTLAAPALAATTLNADLVGTIALSTPTPVPGVQVFTLTGGFTSFSASPDLPQITGGDLGFYSFTITGTSSGYDDATRTATYSGVTGTINGYGQVVQTLLPTTLTVAFDPTFATGAVSGTLLSAGSVTPPGFPGPIDFSPANGASITGLFTATGPGGGTFAGAIAFVGADPVPAPAALGLLGVGLLVPALRRARR